MGWFWLYLGAGIMLLELITPGFVIFFFGLAAATVGVIRFLVGDAFDLTWQVSAFSILSILYILFLRKLFKKIFLGDVATDKSVDDDITGSVGVVTQAVEPPLSGRVMLRDAEWSAQAPYPIANGERVKVVSRDNLTLNIERI